MEQFVFVMSPKGIFKPEKAFSNGAQRALFAEISVPSIYTYRAQALAEAQAAKVEEGQTALFSKTATRGISEHKRGGGIFVVCASDEAQAVRVLFAQGFQEDSN
jgi:hypothetical protein